jgi:hypothetical protein
VEKVSLSLVEYKEYEKKTKFCGDVFNSSYNIIIVLCVIFSIFSTISTLTIVTSGSWAYRKY